jgi:hypothetical protein
MPYETILNNNLLHKNNDYENNSFIFTPLKNIEFTNELLEDYNKQNKKLFISGLVYLKFTNEYCWLEEHREIRNIDTVD